MLENINEGLILLRDGKSDGEKDRIGSESNQALYANIKEKMRLIGKDIKNIKNTKVVQIHRVHTLCCAC